MLEKFSVKNYRNFKNEIILDFNSKRDYQFNKNCIKDNLLNKIIIFGHNGAGKSNFGYALFDIVGTLTDKMSEPLLDSNYINADSDSNIAEFCYNFKFDDDRVILKYSKSAFKSLVSEELIVNDSLVYSFDYNNKKMSENIKLDIIEASTLNFNYFESNISILKYIANNTNQSEKSIVSKIMNFVTKMLWFRSLKNNTFIGYESEGTSVSEWIVNNNLVGEFNDFLRENAKLNLNLGSAKMLDKSILVENHKKAQLIWGNVASSGSSALIIYFYWYKRFNDVKFVYMDEFDAFYHSELAKNIIKTIITYNDMQTILTSHNTILADNKLLRPDCYFILDQGKLESFADKTDREIREGHNLEKMLRQGEFDD